MTNELELALIRIELRTVKEDKNRLALREIELEKAITRIEFIEHLKQKGVKII